MSEEERLRALRRINLGLLCYFRDFCGQHDLRFFLCGGGCIGAVREGGFLPWDDDADVFMPRPDYERLKAIWNREADPRYYCQFTTETVCDRVPFVTVRDLGTTCVKTEQAGLPIPHGVALDILPLDGCPAGLSRKRQKLDALLFMLFNTSRVPDHHGKAVTLGGKLLLALVPRRRHYALSKWLERRMTRWEFGSTPLVTELCSGPYYLQKEYRYADFSDAVTLPFENTSMPLPVGYDGYLRTAFGDYRTPPPETERHPQHDFLYFDPDLPAAEYERFRRQGEEGIVLQGEELRRLQQKTLELFERFYAFCKEKGLRCMLCGGGCIGAVREGGFLPWDDDLDVFMPRPDYERMCELLRSDPLPGIRCERTDSFCYTRFQFAVVSDEETTFVKLRQRDLDISHGIRIDVLPIDGCPDSRLQRLFQLYHALMRSLYIVGEPHTSKGKLLEFFSRVILLAHPTYASRMRAASFHERRMSRYPFDTSRKTTELCAWFGYMRNEYDSAWFRETTELPFEGTRVPVPAGYDAYLRMAFGDYLTPPPEHERIPKHEIAFCDPDHGYRDYRGLYYCCEPNFTEKRNLL